MDMMKTHGAFSWLELTTTDPKAALSFYTTLFGWTVQTMEMSQGSYNVVHIGDTPVGGIMAPAPGAPATPPAWGCYITVENVDLTAAHALALGGRVLVEPMDIPGVGRFCMIQDPQGAMVNLITYEAG
ncbi:MAG TPA: VOC family protein [Methylibium sp.]|nr:VOC family protein [Methylibium sp.]